MEEETALQPENRAEHLKPWQFKKGQSGNPNGKPKGAVSLKTWAKNYIQTLTNEEKLEFLEGMNKKDIWEMAEGKPEAKTDLTSDGEKIVFIPAEVANKHGINTSTKKDSEVSEEISGS